MVDPLADVLCAILSAEDSSTLSRPFSSSVKKQPGRWEQLTSSSADTKESSLSYPGGETRFRQRSLKVKVEIPKWQEQRVPGTALYGAVRQVCAGIGATIGRAGLNEAQNGVE